MEETSQERRGNLQKGHGHGEEESKMRRGATAHPGAKGSCDSP